MVKEAINGEHSLIVSWRKGNHIVEGDTMVEFVKISKKGKLVRIKEVPDKFRNQLYRWDEDE